MKKGFTLLELLVVVLIIGILASIALPQYTKAVEKARLSEALSVVKSLVDSAHRFLYEHDSGEEVTFSKLDVEFPADEDEVYVTNHFNYYLEGSLTKTSSVAIEAERNNGSYLLITQIKLEGDPLKVQTVRGCITKETEVGRYICGLLRDQGWGYCDTMNTCTLI